MMRNKTDKGESIPKYNVLKSIIFTILGIGCIIVGSSLVVDSASFIAKHLGVSERLISLTIIALGTSCLLYTSFLLVVLFLVTLDD